MLFSSSAHLPRNGAVALGSAAPAEAASPSRQNDAIAATDVDFFTATSLGWRCDVCHAVIAEGGERDASIFQRAIHRRGPEQVDADPGIDSDQVAPPTAVDADLRQFEDAALDVD